jgi:hypothetical protein
MPFNFLAGLTVQQQSNGILFLGTTWCFGEIPNLASDIITGSQFIGEALAFSIE